MPADRPPDVLLLAPAFDTGASPGAGPPGTPPGALPAAGTDALEAALADGSSGGRFARHALEPLPWEARLMAALGLLDAGLDPVASRSAVPLARLLGPDDLDGRQPAGDDPVGDAPDAGEPGPSAVAGERRPRANGGWLVVADPVALSPGNDEATLAPPESLGLTDAEADALIAAANALLGEDGVALARGRSGRWYLDGLDPAGLDTPPTHFLARREIGVHLPASSDAAPWRRLMTELQMLWHVHPVNEARAARGASPVSGVWFWGAASLPEAPVRDGAPPALLAAEPFARAAGRHAGATLVDPGTSLDEALAGAAGSDTLIVVDLAPYAAWLGDDAGGLEAARDGGLGRWVRPGAAAVAAGRASSFEIVGDAGRARFEPAPRVGWLQRLFGGAGR